MSDTDTATLTRSKPTLDVPWNVIVINDPVNLMDYVIWVLMKVFGFPKPQAKTIMMRIHSGNECVVWTGQREQAEHYVQLLHSYQLQATMEPSE